MPEEKAKLWSSENIKGLDSSLNDFNSSLDFDYVLIEKDIEATKAHVKMLEKQGILEKADLDSILNGLDKLLEDFNNFTLDDELYEDIHSFVELNLTSLIGKNGKKIHTGRSRNDLVATDLRLWLRDELDQSIKLLELLLKSLIERAEADIDCFMPGYTHLQQAQIISLAHHWLAHVARFKRDIERLKDCRKRVNHNPLGSGALAGSTIELDRFYTSELMKFSAPCDNSLDAVSDRDFVLEYEFCLSAVMMHLSQLSEELIIWNSQEFSYIKISDSFATGSSMMPQKKNPDLPELIRGKTGRVFSAFTAMFMTIKGLALAYNKDLQEDKEMLFMANENTQTCISMMAKFLQNITINSARMYSNCENSFMAATDLAEYLVKKGLAFRDAYKITGDIVAFATKNNKYLKDLSLEEYQKHSGLFTEDIFTAITPESCVDARMSYGGTSRIRIKEQIKKQKEQFS